MDIPTLPRVRWPAKKNLDHGIMHLLFFPPQFVLTLQNSKFKHENWGELCGVPDFIRNKGWSITLCSIFYILK